MFRIRECFVDSNQIYVGVDGELSDKNLGLFREIIEKYLGRKMNVFVSLIDLKHIGLEGKKFLKKIHDQGVSLDLPDYLKIEIINADDEDSAEKWRS